MNRLRITKSNVQQKTYSLSQLDSTYGLLYLLSLLWLSSMLSACGTATSSSPLPPWVMNTPLGCGLGSLQINGSMTLAKSGAIAKGRADLARQIQTRIENVIKTYRSEGGGKQ
ncbi:MAG: hypothetical protein CMH49_06915, partial [Myxococcales bacterium]|nr:hypothetical protein [Myxococcales bacterium]